MNVSIIVAVAKNGVIGDNNKLVWNLKADLRHFKTLTTDNIVIMGRKTYDSIGRPLPNRINMVISRNANLKIDGCLVFNNLYEAIKAAKAYYKEVFIIGGAEIYNQALPYANTIYLTRVIAEPKGDTYLDLSFLKDFKIIKSEFKPKDLDNDFDVYFEKLENQI